VEFWADRKGLGRYASFLRDGFDHLFREKVWGVMPLFLGTEKVWAIMPLL